MLQQTRWAHCLRRSAKNDLEAPQMNLHGPRSIFMRARPFTHELLSTSGPKVNHCSFEGHSGVVVTKASPSGKSSLK